MSRRDQASDIVALLQRNGLEARVAALNDGWPARVVARLDGIDTTLALYVGLIGEPGVGSTGARPQAERRFQNPGKNHPIGFQTGEVPLLLGLSTEQDPPVLAAYDPFIRLGMSTRISFQIHLPTLLQAASDGLSTQTRTSGEVIVAFRPDRFLDYMRDLRPVLHVGAVPGLADVEASVAAAEFDSAADSLAAAGGSDEVVARLREAASRLVRSARFRREVSRAYGRKCAACGTQLRLDQAAHLFPASQPGSPDTIDNGICLCANHHLAFDAGLLRIDPDTWALSLDDERLSFLEASDLAGGADSFRVGLSASVTLPENEDDLPDGEWLRRRYEAETQDR